MAAEWFFAKGDKKLGPVTNKGLKELAASGRIQPDTLVWRDGLPEWIPAGRVEELFPAEPSSEAASPEPEPEQEEFAEAEPEAAADHELPPVRWKPATPGKPPSVPPSRRPLAGPHNSTERLRWWLLFYAKVNFALSCLIGAPIVIMGLFVILISSFSGGGNVRINPGVINALSLLMLGTSLLAGLMQIAFGVLVFMLLNVFTLACAWGAEVLRLLNPPGE